MNISQYYLEIETEGKRVKGKSLFPLRGGSAKRIYKVKRGMEREVKLQSTSIHVTK